MLKKWNEIWDKISNIFKKGFDSEPVYNDKRIKTKIKIYNNEINMNFHGNKMPVHNECCTCLSVILLTIINNDLYPQVFLEECKYAIKKKKIMNTINKKILMNLVMSLTMMMNIMKIRIIF